jgi:hypothetical protein
MMLMPIPAGLIMAGCSDDKPTGNNNNPGDTTSTTTTVWNSSGYWDTSNLDASDTAQAADYTYYSFSQRDTMTLTDQQAENDTSWDIAFKRNNVILNGGVSGSGNLDGVDLAAINNADSTDFMAFDDPSSIGDNDWQRDHYELMITDWYSYNPDDHSFSVTGNVFILKDAVGNYVKFRVESMMNPGAPPDMGMISLLYIFSGSSRNFSGMPDTLTFDATSGGPIYVDFSSGSTVNPANPDNSTEWDIVFINYEIHQNNSMFGSGSTETYPVWQLQDDPTDFNETMVAPPEPEAYFADTFASVLTDWYAYNPETHQLPSRNHVYIIRDASVMYKLQIVTYYKNVGGNAVSGWYTFRWAALE